MSEYSTEDLDILRVIKMTLIHDLVEIYAGTRLLDKKGSLTKRGEGRLPESSIWPADQAREFRDLWKSLTPLKHLKRDLLHALTACSH